MERVVCLLPGGYADRDGVVHRDVELAALSGREEEILAGRRPVASPALVTTILSRCLHRLGTISPVTETLTRQLLVADRQFLLLQLRLATFGERVIATITCTSPDCKAMIDIDFSLDNIPVRASAQKGPVYQMELSSAAAFTDDQGTVHRTVAFRLPNGEDQEQLAPLVADDEAIAATSLLARCIQGLGTLHEPGEVVVAKLSPLACAEIEQAMDAAAPQIDCTLEIECPECEQDVVVPFDFQGFFFQECATNRNLLYREVHYLAYHYHWSEQDILAMTRVKRRKYIEVLADEIERLHYGS